MVSTPPAAAPVVSTGAAALDSGAAQRRRRRKFRASLAAYLLVLPAAGFYIFFVLRPIALSAQYSFYEWNGIGPATWVGFANYVEVFSNPKLTGAIGNAFELII